MAETCLAPRPEAGRKLDKSGERWSMRKVELLEPFWRDIVYALRTMSTKPAFEATAVLTLAFAIGGNTAMFTVIRAVLLKPLPFSGSDRLVHIMGGATPARFVEMRPARDPSPTWGRSRDRKIIRLSGFGILAKANLNLLTRGGSRAVLVI